LAGVDLRVVVLPPQLAVEGAVISVDLLDGRVRATGEGRVDEDEPEMGCQGSREEAPVLEGEDGRVDAAAVEAEDAG
jgi:hypothetical protein